MSCQGMIVAAGEPLLTFLFCPLDKVHCVRSNATGSINGWVYDTSEKMSLDAEQQAAAAAQFAQLGPLLSDPPANFRVLNDTFKNQMVNEKSGTTVLTLGTAYSQVIFLPSLSICCLLPPKNSFGWHSFHGSLRVRLLS